MNNFLQFVANSHVKMRRNDIKEAFQLFKEKSNVLHGNGNKYVDNSDSRSANQVWHHFPTTNRDNVIWIVDGVVTEDCGVLIDIVEKRTKAIINLGQDVLGVSKAFGKVGLIYNTYGNLKEAIDMVLLLQNSGDIVYVAPLLSPFVNSEGIIQEIIRKS